MRLFDDLHKEWMKNPEYAKEYERLEKTFGPLTELAKTLAKFEVQHSQQEKERNENLFRERTPIEVSCGNIFQDLDLENPEMMLLRAEWLRIRLEEMRALQDGWGTHEDGCAITAEAIGRINDIVWQIGNRYNLDIVGMEKLNLIPLLFGGAEIEMNWGNCESDCLGGNAASPRWTSVVAYEEGGVFLFQSDKDTPEDGIKLGRDLSVLWEVLDKHFEVDIAYLKEHDEIMTED